MKTLETGRRTAYVNEIMKITKASVQRLQGAEMNARAKSA